MGDHDKGGGQPTPPVPLPELLEELDIPKEAKDKLEQAFFVQTTYFEAVTRPVPSPDDMAKYGASRLSVEIRRRTPVIPLHR